jgi:ATP-dependent DNA helicase RecG
MIERLLNNLQYLKGVGSGRAALLKKMGLLTVFDLLWQVPRDYEDLTHGTPIRDLTEGPAVLQGKVTEMASVRTRRGIALVKALIEDDTGGIEALWFNQPFVAKQLRPGMDLLIKGKVQGDMWQKQVAVSYYEVKKGEAHVSLDPVYPLTEGINQKNYREWIRAALNEYLPDYPEILNADLRAQYDLLGIQEAWRGIHFPTDQVRCRQARKRLAIEELLLLRLLAISSAENPADSVKERRPARRELVSALTAALPYRLTGAQQRVLQEIRRDLAAPCAMNRLLQGDVGSGKTVVAFLSMLEAVERGHQAALMAPTEILIRQHWEKLRPLAEQLGLTIALLTSATSARERVTILEALADGSLDIILGTHALLQADIVFHSLDFIVIDEQHRFGVKQRAFLKQKAVAPDVLVMTATPIPRTLALVIYGQLRVSVIDEMPPGRKKVKTKFIPLAQWERAYAFVAGELRRGGQAYVVCPLIEGSEETQDLANAVELYEDLRRRFQPDIQVGLVHGRMKSDEKQAVMEAFKAGRVQLLVSTTVIEVGVDVPTANVVVIEHADRFGLSQLHQLRGRVGRGERQSYCILLGDPATEQAVKRLRAMEQTDDGFVLANLDLTLRGPGDMWGFKQHGLEALKIVRLDEDQAEISGWTQTVERLAEQLNPVAVDAYLTLKFPERETVALN